MANPPDPTKCTVSLSASTVNIGSAVTITLQARDSSDNFISTGGALVGFSASGGTSRGMFSATVDHGNGTYTATYTGVASGTAQTIFATINRSAVTTPMPTIVVSSAYTTPDILNNASFEPTDGDGTATKTGQWDGFTDWANSTPTAALDPTMAAPGGGTQSVKYAWTPNPGTDAGSHFIYHYAAQDRVWVRFYFRVTNHISSTWKWARIGDQSFKNFGGLWLERDGTGTGIIGWGWDAEDGSIVTTIGLTEAQVIDGNWHSLEFDFWRNGDPSGWPSAAFWFDGRPQYAELNGHGKITYWGAGNNSYWDAAGRLQAGVRSSSSRKLGYQTFMSTLNAGNTTSGQCNIDLVSISSLGRIGP
jgi:hypothetical protein